MTFANKNNWREGYSQCRAGFTKASSWKRSAENERSMLCAGVTEKFSRAQNVRTSCLAPALSWPVGCLSKLRDLGQSRGCFPQLHCLLSYPGLITCTVRASLSEQQQLQCQLEALISEKWAPCFGWWQHLPRGIQQPNMGIFWITLTGPLAGWTNLFCKCSH